MRSPLPVIRDRLEGGPRTLPVLDVVLGTGLAVAAVVDTATSPGLVHPWTDIFGGLAMGSLVLRGRAPLAMCLLTAASFAAYAAMPGTNTPMWSFIGILAIGFSAGANLDGRRRWIGLGALVASTYVIQVMDAARAPGSLTTAEVYLTPPAIILAPALAGWLLQRSRRQTEELRRLTEQLALERERHAHAVATAERTRIARELHDVISHSVSVMVVQAGAAEQLMDADTPALEQVRAVRETGKEALAELRRQLGLLREGSAGGVAPLPGLDDIADLAKRMGAELVVEGAVAEIASPGLGLAAYRVVQEGLTNARRHAQGAPVLVRIARRGDTLELTVEDGGGDPVEPALRGSGNGLIGLRERVELYGGTVDAGPRRTGTGWRVHALLPLPQGRPA